MIEIKNLHKAFGQNQVLKGVDITVNKGTAGGILGNNYNQRLRKDHHAAVH